MDFVYIMVITGLMIVIGIMVVSFIYILRDIGRGEQTYSPLESST